MNKNLTTVGRSREKLHDAEFSPEILFMLRRREILKSGNWLHAITLDYGIRTFLAGLENLFQTERRENPLLEQTSPEAWATAVILDEIRKIRANVQIRDHVLSQGVQKYLHCHLPPVDRPIDGDEHRLVTTIEPLIPVVLSLFEELFDRRKSIFGILGLRSSSGAIRTIVSATPKSERDKIIVAAINGNWPLRLLAESLDVAKIKPRNRRWKSYMEMYHQDPGQFSVLKSQTKRNYLLVSSKP